MEKQKVESKNVTLYPQDWKDIQAVAESSGAKNTSTALRIILQEWRKLRAMVEVGNVTAAN